MANIFTKVFNERTYKTAIPYILISLGVTCLIYSYFGTFTDEKYRSIVHDLAFAILSGGFFALLLKVIQFMGVFKEELEKVIFEPKYLNNRNDLPKYWDKVSMELFKNKFPGISQKLLKDVKEVYFPTQSPVYHDEVEHFLEITNLTEDGVATFKKTTTLTIVCNEKDGACSYEYGNIMPFKATEAEVEYVSDVIKVNNQSPTDKELLKKKTVSGKNITNKIILKLKGKDKYQIERVEEKKYNIIFDNILAFKSNKIVNKLKVEFHFPNNLDIILKKCGTLEDFKIEREGANFRRYYCNGIIYPQQGYNVIFKINKQQ